MLFESLQAGRSIAPAAEAVKMCIDGNYLVLTRKSPISVAMTAAALSFRWI